MAKVFKKSIFAIFFVKSNTYSSVRRLGVWLVAVFINMEVLTDYYLPSVDNF
jgi:hypothetical protein